MIHARVRISVPTCLPAVAACVLLVLAGCQSGAGKSSGKRTTYGSLREEVEVLREVNRTLEAELTKQRAEHEALARRYAALEEQMALIEADLDLVERQFVIFEERLSGDASKASAVAAVAEAQLRLERLRKETPGGLDPNTEKEAQEKIATAEKLIERRNYPAALYFAGRANRHLRTAHREERTVDQPGDGNFRVAARVANMREGPGESYAIIEQLDQGAVLIPLETRYEWLRVRTQTGHEGWIHSSLVR